MNQQAVESMKEFISTHQEELKVSSVVKTVLFSDYVTYCKAHDYEHHTNLIQFCREIQGDTSTTCRH